MHVHSITQEACIIWSWCLVIMCKIMTSQMLFCGVKGQMTQNYKFQSVALYIKNCRSYHQIMVFPHILYFLKKNTTIINIKILTFFIGPLHLFLTNSCFSISSINGKQKFLGVPCLGNWDLSILAIGTLFKAK